jgi:hypothetical protein
VIAGLIRFMTSMERGRLSSRALRPSALTSSKRRPLNPPYQFIRGVMRSCSNMVIPGGSGQTVLLHCCEHYLSNIIRFLPLSIIEYSSLKNPSTDPNFSYNLAGTASTVLPQLHNCLLCCPILPYNPLISLNHHTLCSGDMLYIVFLDDDQKLKH